jgi:hypothetical protein
MDEDVWRSGEELPLAYDVGFRRAGPVSCLISEAGFENA